MYRYDVRPGKWTRILSGASESTSGAASAEPQPRYAHQVVYDPERKMVFMHGGNAGLMDNDPGTKMGADGEAPAERHKDKEKRLNDFWCMTLKRYGELHHLFWACGWD